MDSAQLTQFSNWRSLSDQGIKNAPSQQGTYVIRKAGGKRFGRLRGESDIVYIGSTTRGLRGRLRQYIHPGPTQWTNWRIHELAKKYNFEVAWYKNNEPENLEHQLLRQYLNEHDELPPLESSRQKATKKSFDRVWDKIPRYLSQNKLCHSVVQKAAVSTRSSLLCAIFHPNLRLSSEMPLSD